MLKSESSGRFKKILYLFLFAALNLIEWLKGTQTGDIWLPAVNCIGIVVAIMILSAYPLKELLHWGYGIYTALCAIAIAVVYGYWATHLYPFILWQYITAIINIWLLGIIAVYVGIRIRSGKQKLPRINLLGIIWILLTIGMTVSLSGRIWPFWFFVLFGLFYVTEYREEDRQALINGMINGTILSFLALQAFAFGFRPYDEVRYKGPFGNCNVTALYYLMVLCMVLFKLHFLTLQKAEKLRRLFWILFAGVLLSFQFITMCRTAWLATAAVLLVYAVWIVGKDWKDKWHKIIAKGLLLLFCTVLAFLPVYMMVRWLPVILHHPIWFEGEWAEEKVHSFDGPNSEKYVSLEEIWDSVFSRILEMLDIAGTCDPFRMEVLAAEEKPDQSPEQGTISMDEEAGSSPENPIITGECSSSFEIRLFIYRTYWKKLNWAGHPANEGHYWLTSDYQIWHAQNLWLQIAYSYGIPSGILMIVLTLVMIFYYLHGYGQGKFHIGYGAVPLLIMVVFFAFGTMEVVWIPGQMILSLFYLVQHPQFRRL